MLALEDERTINTDSAPCCELPKHFHVPLLGHGEASLVLVANLKLSRFGLDSEEEILVGITESLLEEMNWSSL